MASGCSARSNMGVFAFGRLRATQRPGLKSRGRILTFNIWGAYRQRFLPFANFATPRVPLHFTPTQGSQSLHPDYAQGFVAARLCDMLLLKATRARRSLRRRPGLRPVTPSAYQATESGSRNPEVRVSPKFVSSVTFCLASVFASWRLCVRLILARRILPEQILQRVDPGQDKLVFLLDR
jgi:hypothetical protein